MSRLFWSDELFTGITEVDNQHREVFEQITKFLNACEKGKGRQTIHETIAYFENYIRFHFAAEEKIQQQHAYPGLAGHAKLHKELLDKLHDIKSDMARDGASLSLVMKAMQFWADWFVHHIAKEDKAIADHLRKKGAIAPVS